MDVRLRERWAGWLSIAAGAIHGGVAPEHFAQWWGYGAFFVAAAIAQTLFGLVLVTRGIEAKTWSWARILPVLCWLGILGNLAILGLWAITRTTGIPWFGPGAGTVEGVGGVDVLSKVVEAAVIVLLVSLLQANKRLVQPRADA